MGDIFTMVGQPSWKLQLLKYGRGTSFCRFSHRRLGACHLLRAGRLMEQTIEHPTQPQERGSKRVIAMI